MKLGVVLAVSTPWLGKPLVYMGAAGVNINIILMVLNLFPLPPLDGGRVMAGLLPDRLAWQFSRIEPWGMFIIIGLMITGILGAILTPVIRQFEGLIYAVLGL